MNEKTPGTALRPGVFFVSGGPQTEMPLLAMKLIGFV